MPPESLPQQSHTPRTQEELRDQLQQRLDALGLTVKGKIEEYQKALNEGTFNGPEGQKKQKALEAEIQQGTERGRKMLATLESPNPLPQSETTLTTTYTHPDKHQE